MGMPSFAQIEYPRPADYSRSKVELYTDITAWCIRKTNSLRVLYYNQHLEEAGEFPSWVPQWDRKTRYEPIEDSLTKLRWKSSNDTELQVDIDIGSRVIRLTGIEFDVIESQRRLEGNIQSHPQVSPDHPVLEFWEKQKSNPTPYPTEDSSLDALSFVLTAGLDQDQRKASKNSISFKADFTAYLDRLSEVAENGTQLCEDKGAEEPGDWFNYETLIRNKCYNRTLFSTRKGYLGLGPDCHKGDLVCLMFGGEVPFVLRPKDGYYQLVGDAYVHGIMDGEAMRLYNPLDMNKRQFEIH
ncbi:hypothetical protein ABKA04_005212 [Annulohypoxylon sp. FPYF3050]